MNWIILNQIKIAAAFLIIFGIEIFGGHPLRTDDAATIGNNKFEFELTSEFSVERNYKEMSFPVTLTYGLFDNTDIALSTCGHHGWVTGIRKNSSWGDLSLELKTIFKGEAFDFGIKPFLTLPTGNFSEGFGTGKTTFGMYILLTRTFEKINLYSQIGYQRNNNIVNEDHNHWEISLAGEYQLSEKSTLVLELGGARDLSPRDEDHPVFVLGGLTYSISHSIVFDLGLLKGINETEMDLGILTGFTFAL